MKKQDGSWYSHFTLEKEVKVPDEPETVIGIDRGEKNFAVGVAFSKDNSYKPRKGMFWDGSEIKAEKGKYHHIRRSLGKKKAPQMIGKIKHRLKEKTDQQLHMLANKIIDYVSQFKKPIIALEDLTHLRKSFSKRKKSKWLN